MRRISLNRAASPALSRAASGSSRSLHVGADAGRLWIVVGRWSVLIAPSHVIVGLMLLVLSLAVAVVSLRLGKFPSPPRRSSTRSRGRGARSSRSSW